MLFPKMIHEIFNAYRCNGRLLLKSKSILEPNQDWNRNRNQYWNRTKIGIETEINIGIETEIKIEIEIKIDN